MQLSQSLVRLSRAMAQTANLCEQMKGNLDAMKTLSANHAAQWVTNPMPRLTALDTSLLMLLSE